ncbi:hypothetical protein FNV43_RR09080 [Rhamnella rubrinervis]|uniref:Hydrophobic seed protein domain-containing protein n=1 Tax=Rhamnella rubrinervis TaxID=2594499 RepID=A0A8K0H9D4_9ROSA|nr:hypothetical protein FNV43_RR09080 [Rhamnella rubrinervis]
MGSKTSAAPLGLFLTVNLIFFTLVSGCGLRRPCPKPKALTQASNAAMAASSATTATTSSAYNSTNYVEETGTCSKNALTFNACTGLLNGLLNYTIGTPPTTPCCSIMNGLVDFEASTCLCIAFKANIMGFQIPEIPICIALILNAYSRSVPVGFQCSE